MVEEIGEAIGEAFGTLADFIGSAMEHAMGLVLGTLYKAGDTVLKQFLIEAEGSDTDIKSNLDVLKAKIDTDFLDDVHANLLLASDYEGPMPFGDAQPTLSALYTLLDENIVGAAVFATLLEVCSLGQVEGAQKILDVGAHNKAFVDVAHNYSLMRYNAALFAPYERELNAKYQNLIPQANDNVRFALREVWDPTRRTELLTELPGGEYYSRLNQNGFSNEIGDDYWAAHWVLPSVGQLNEMLHRRVIDEPIWDRFVKYNDFDPTVRPWLKEISYNPYTRVDIRRMLDLRLVTRDEVKDNYLDLGYDDEHAEKMTVWTLAYTLAVELRARYSKGWITADDIRSELAETGMPAARIEDYLQKIIKAETQGQVDAERDLTKTDITRSVKKGIITEDEGITRLMDLGYGEAEAEFILESILTEQISEEIEKDRELSKSDILEGVSVGVIPWDDGKTMLINLGYSEDEADYILNIRVPPAQTRRIIKERDLTKAEIVKGVKKEILTFDEGRDMLIDLGYDTNEATFILDISVEVLAGSPSTWSEFQRLVNEGRAATRQPVKEIDPGILQLEKQIMQLEKKITRAKGNKKTKKPDIELTQELKTLKARLSRLIKQRRRN